MDLIEKYGTPLKFSYLPKITSQIEKSRDLFQAAFEKYNYEAKYNYCYCTKSSHFSFVLNQVLKSGVDLETSSAFDLSIIERLEASGKFKKDQYIVCNGYKTEQYAKNISKLVNNGFTNLTCVLDNIDEFELINAHTNRPTNLGIRIATEEEPNFLVYTSRLGMSHKKIIDLYQEKI